MFVAHRVNTIDELSKIPRNMGIELDLRDSSDGLIIAHDPFLTGELFENYLKNYCHSFMIVNIKSERIELEAKKLLEKYHISDYFFLDSTVPMIINYGKQPGFKFATRVSEFESIQSAISLKKFASWVWVDCFERLPITFADFLVLKQEGLKLCFVSPELQGRENDIEKYINNLKILEIIPDMVCSKYKNYEYWKSYNKN